MIHVVILLSFLVMASTTHSSSYCCPSLALKKDERPVGKDVSGIIWNILSVSTFFHVFAASD